MTVRYSLWFSSVALTILAVPAFAADAPSEPLGDIVVTAQKRTERLVDVPAAITVLNSDQFAEIGAHSTRDLIGYVPGLALQTNGISNSLIIRGISASGTISTPLVGTIIDGVPYGSTSGQAFGGSTAINVNLADVDRIEVLKGPQGTLYGASAMGGLLSYVLKSSIPAEFEATGTAETFGTDHGQASFVIEGGVAAPIISDKVGLRLSGFYNNYGGFLDNPRTNAHDTNAAYRKGGRAAVDMHLTETLRIDLSAIYQSEKLDANDAAFYRADRTPIARDYTSNAAILSASKRTFQQYTGRISQDFGFASLTSLTSWSKVETSTISDQTDTSFGALFKLFNPAAVTAYSQNLPSTKKFTEELRLASSSSTGIRWLIGGFYTHEHSDLYQNFYGATSRGLSTVAPLSPAIALAVPSIYKEYAAFGNVTVPIGRFEITGGGRYSHNDQQFQELASGALAPVFGLTAVGPLSKSSANRFDYSGSIKYKLNASANVYVRVASGYRAGGPNTSFPGIPSSYGPDHLVNYEAGFKSSFLNGLASIDVAAFYVDWRNIQVTASSGNIGYFANGGKARSQGFEASGTLRPIAGLSLTGSLAYTDATLRQDIPSLSGHTGDRLVNSPKWSGSVIADYRRPLSEKVTGVLGANFQYIGSRESGYPASITTPDYVLKAFSQVDLRAGIETGPVSITAFVRNLANNRADLAATYLAPVYQVAQLRPRQIGVRVGFKY